MKFKKSVIAGVLSSTLFLGGCANHLRNTERITQEEEKNVLKTKYELKLSPETIKDTYYHIDIQRFASVSVKKYELEDDLIHLEIMVAEDDLKRVIGRAGKTINSIRNIVWASASLNGLNKVKIDVDSY